MKNRFPWALAAFLLLPFSLYGHQQHATVTATCKALMMQNVSWMEPSSGVRYTSFTTYDGSPALLYTNDGLSTYYGGELRRRSGHPGVYETDFATEDAASNLIASGSATFSLPSTDVDGNGVPDFMQFERAANYSAAGSLVEDHPHTSTSTFAGNFSKAANSTRTSYSATLTTGASTIEYSGSFETIYIQGGISYSRSPNSLSIVATQTSASTAFTYTGTNISFTVNSVDQFSLQQTILTRNDGIQITLLPATFHRVGNRYVAHVEVDDGDDASHWRDYTRWVFELVDSNDWDGDGIPDLSDEPPSAPLISKHPASRLVQLGSPTTFRVTASANPPPAYQWRKDGVPIPGATQSAFTIPTVSLSDAGAYAVMVKNFVGKQLSEAAALTVCGYNLGAAYQFVEYQGGNHSVALTTTGPCDWSIQNTNGWITFSQSNGNGSALLSYEVAANSDPTARAAYIRIAGKSFIVNQRGTPAPTQPGINGRTIVFTATSSSGALPSYQTYLLNLSQAGNQWRQVTREGEHVGSGTFAYEQLSNSQIALTLGTGDALHLTFASSTDGQATYTAAGGDTQSGTFVITEAKPDFDNDGFSDLLWQHVNGTVRAWFMKSSSYEGAANIKKLASGWRVAGQTDLNHDGHTDLVLQHQDLRLVGWLLNSTNFLSAVPIAMPGKGARLVGIADFDKNERDDFLFQNGNNILFVRLMNGTTVTGSKLLRGGTPLPPGFTMAQVADLNRDGETDLVLQGSDGRIIAWLLNGTDLISAVLIRKVGPGWKVVGANDLNFDGHPDLLLYNKDGRLAAWLMHDSGLTSALALSNGQPVNTALRLVGPK